MLLKLNKVTLILGIGTILLSSVQSFRHGQLKPLDVVKFDMDPPEVSSMGHEVVRIKGLNLTPGSTAFCLYNDLNNNSPLNNVTATIVSPTLALCPVPYLYSWDVKVDFVVNGDDNQYQGDLRVKEFHADTKAVASVLCEEGGLAVTVKWDPAFFSNDERLDLVILKADPLWAEVMVIDDLPNSGEYTYILSAVEVAAMPDLVTYQLRSKFAEKFAFSNVLVGLSTIPDPNVAQSRCDEWFAGDDGPPMNVEPCPCTLSQAMLDPRFAKEDYDYPDLDYYHPGASVSYRQSTPNDNGAGSQCVYAGDQIRVGQPSGGSADWSSPLNSPDLLGHLRNDILPWTFCCKESENEAHCRKYYDKRPSDGCDTYEPPTPGGGSGDPHMKTFDRINYDFMGVGEFWVVKMADKFGLQGRMEPLPNSVTQFTAFAMDDGSTRVQVDTVGVAGGPLVRVDGEIVSLAGGEIVTPTATIKKEATKITASFAAGFSVAMQGNSVLVTASSANKGQTAGLLGDFDLDGSNDLRAPDGTITPVGSSRAEIHTNFGLPWMITKEESMFVYPEGLQYEDFNHPDAPPNVDEPDLGDIPEEIIKMCGDSLDCLYDFAFTNDTEAANQTRQQEEELSELVDNLDEIVPKCRSITDANIPNGFVNIANYFVGSAAEFGCNPGFQLTGEQTIYCLQGSGDPRWSDNVPSCT